MATSIHIPTTSSTTSVSAGSASLRTLTRSLVLALIPPLRTDPTTLRQVTEHISREVRADVQGVSRKTWEDAEPGVRGLARTAHVRVQTDLAEGLEAVLEKLQDHRTRGEAVWEDDMPVKMSNVPQHIQLLLALSDRPSPSTHNFAHDYLLRLERAAIPAGPTADQLLFREIMAEPFAGDHWGAGFDEEVKDGWSDSDGESRSDDSERGGRSETSGSADDEVLVTPLKSRSSPLSDLDRARLDAERRLRVAEDQLREFAKGRYWVEGGEVVQRHKGELYGWKTVSTGLSAISLGHTLQPDWKQLKAISAAQFQRELLYALSGRPGIMLAFDAEGACFIKADHPDVRQYSPSALTGILHTFRDLCAQISRIRRYIATTLSPARPSSKATQPQTGRVTTKTGQAFAEACRSFITGIDDWLADQEMAFVRGDTEYSSASHGSTPITLESDLRRRTGPLIDAIDDLLAHAEHPVALLDTLCAATTSIGLSPVHTKHLHDIFVSTATPMWSMLGDWMVRGMPIPDSLLSRDVDHTATLSEDERALDDEFLIKRDRDVSWADEDFWEAAFVLQEGYWPLWCGGGVVGEMVLEAGKARGLLTSLTGGSGYAEPWLGISTVLANVSDPDSVPDEITTYLKPICQLATFHLRQILDNECGLEQHLDAISGTLYMRGHLVLNEWSDWLFDKIRIGERWTDSQVVTSTLRDMIERSGEFWLNPTAIRIRADPHSKSPPALSPRTVSIIQASYQVPFPLSQLFTTTSLDLRADVFSFLLQVRFARYLLRQTGSSLPTITPIQSQVRQVANQPYMLLHRLNWIIDTIWIWVNTMIEIECESYRAKLAGMSSLRDMIQLELAHTRRIRSFCFQHERTSTVNDAAASVLHLCAQFYRLINEQAVLDNSHSQPSPQAHYVQGRSRQRRSRGRRRRRVARESDSDSEGDENGNEIAEEERPSESNDKLISQLDPASRGDGSDGEYRGQLRRIDADLATYVAILKAGVEELALGDHPVGVEDLGGSKDAVGNSGGDEVQVREIWGMLEFALLDWR